MAEPPSEARRPKRRHGDVAAAITGYMREHPHADYFEMLNDLYVDGYRVNRHGNIGLMEQWQAATAAR